MHEMQYKITQPKSGMVNFVKIKHLLIINSFVLSKGCDYKTLELTVNEDYHLEIWVVSLAQS